MQVISKQMAEYNKQSSWIRRMFEAGIEMKKEFGADKVYDFSLGNPDMAPPTAVSEALRELADRAAQPASLGYMPNAGFPEVRARLAEHLTAEQGVELGMNDVIMTCGAAGAINVFFQCVLDPGDEVLCPSPIFVDYWSYVRCNGGQLVPIATKPLTFELDLDAIDAAITDKTRAVIVNSPNNPTGQVYSRESLQGLAAILERHSKKNGRPIFLVADEPYRFLVYDDIEVPSVLPLYDYSVVVSSFSKSLALAGERVGFAALCPDMEGKEELLGSMIVANRFLGFINAPTIGQYLLLKALGHCVDTSSYVSRRKSVAGMLDKAGVEYSMPKGGFYFFPRVPGGGDDVEFSRVLMEEKILVTPGVGFNCPGYFRVAFCTEQSVIDGAVDGFVRAVEKF